MSNETEELMRQRIRETYNVPPATPLEPMWSAINTRIGVGGAEADVIDIESARERAAQRAGRGSSRSTGWAVAAAAVLVLGIGIGRMTAPKGGEGAMVANSAASAQRSLALAARDYLGQTESFLTMVRADGRAGRVDPATAEWAKGLLSQTRILLDAQTGVDPAVEGLLLDLELILVQIAGVSETGSMEEGRARTEIDLAIQSLEEGEVMTRIQAALPAMAGA